MPNGLGGAGSGFINGRLYVAGGRDASNTILDTLYIYDPATNTWSKGPPMPQPENVPGYTVSVTNAEDGVRCALYLFGYGNPLSGVRAARARPDETSSFGPTAGATTLIYDPADRFLGVRVRPQRREVVQLGLRSGTTAAPRRGA